MNLRLSILNFVTPISKWISKIHAPYSRKIIDSSLTIDAIRVMNPGSVLISKTFGELANIFIPGDFSHAAIYNGSFIIEAKTKGVSRTNVFDFMMSKDDVIILEPLFCDEGAMLDAAIKCSKMIGKPYDFNFDPSTSAFYCSELVSYGYSDFPQWNKRTSFGVETVIPDDFYKSSRSNNPKWKIGWDSEIAKLQGLS